MITSIEVLKLKKDGAFYPITVFSEEEMSAYLKQFEILEARAKKEELYIDEPHLHFGWVYRLATHPKILSVIEAVLGPNILVHSSTFFAKHPKEGLYVSWHQDGHYWGLERPELMTVWLAFTHSTVENGCMRYLPGSHLQKLPHNLNALDEKNLSTTGLQVADTINEANAEDVVLKPGQISLHQVNTLHGSNANNSNTRRIGLAIRYLTTGIPQRRIHYKVIAAKGTDEFKHFELLSALPSDDLEKGIKDMIAFTKDWKSRLMKQSAQPTSTPNS